MAGEPTPAQLREMAEAAFDVQNWAKRLGMKKDQQLDETVKAFEVVLGMRLPTKEPS